MEASHKPGKYLLLDPIASVCYGQVYKAIQVETQREVAFKKLRKQDCNLTLIEKEVKMLSSLNHPNIIKLLDFIETKQEFFLVYEMCQMGSLEDVIENDYNGMVHESLAQRIIEQILEGMKYLRENKIVHRNLAMNNFLVTKDFVIKIADFGFATYADNDEYLTAFCGVPLYMAPEVLEIKRIPEFTYTPKCDVWSLGVIFYQMVFGRLPYLSADEQESAMTVLKLLEVIKRMKVEFPDTREVSVSESFKDLILKMLVVIPEHRISVEDIGMHDWLVNWRKTAPASPTKVFRPMRSVEISGEKTNSAKKKKKQREEKEVTAYVGGIKTYTVSQQIPQTQSNLINGMLKFMTIFKFDFSKK